jgi:ATP-dependent Clp protease ATP-binding subunit ClpA/ATP-dependent Clp protease ATP-binding subunit ClpC
VNLTVHVYVRRRNLMHTLVTLGLPPAQTVTQTGKSLAKVQQKLTSELRKRIGELSPAELPPLEPARGLRLERVRLELTLRGAGGKRRLSGLFPLIIEPRWANATERLLLAYHPMLQDEWFPLREAEPTADQAQAFFQHAWAELDEDALGALPTDGKDGVRLTALSARPKSLLDQLADSRRGIWDDLRNDPLERGKKAAGPRGGYKILPRIAVNLTTMAAGGTLPPGMPRSPAREQLQLMLSGARKQPTVVLGPPGAGKTTVIRRFVHDLLAADDYPSHQNLDRVTDVWALSGKRVIAGMSYVGDWEERCLQIVEDARARRALLYVEDLHLWGQIGRSRQSDRNLAEFFRGPVARGEITIVGECTPAQLERLEHDAPAFARLLSRVVVPPTGPAETLRLMIHEARRLEPEHQVS